MMNDWIEAMEDMGAEPQDVIERLGDDEESYLYYLKKFPENQNVKNMQVAFKEKNFEKAQSEVHTLKGVTLNLGLLPLADICIEMLDLLRSNDNDGAESLLSDVEESFSEWIGFINSNL